MSAKYAICLT
ncbi:unnamed protein product [Acanthoscelides obtectus]|uniref:Uncharacterized protein n=1 Tax=Acanthoscelides obtectus TaxID=200917 RepID=A0A9P0LQ36_ACAOB|nr:unnamed protein product [Acanthoscelides obtectus]CAK1670733.1 hypothetical protein AOBTE_LOCUS27797 [Acanthoscelides obtectus]